MGFNNIDAIKFNFEYYYGKEKSVDAKVNRSSLPVVLPALCVNIQLSSGQVLINQIIKKNDNEEKNS